MGQQIIQDLLNKHPNRRFTGREIAHALNINYNSCNSGLKAMRHRDEIGFEEKIRTKDDPSIYCYFCKR